MWKTVDSLCEKDLITVDDHRSFMYIENVEKFIVGDLKYQNMLTLTLESEKIKIFSKINSPLLVRDI